MLSRASRRLAIHSTFMVATHQPVPDPAPGKPLETGALVRIRDLYPRFTEKERLVADFVLSTTDLSHRTITQVVRASGASYGSVDRFCKRLGYSGFQDLKIHLAEDRAARRAARPARQGSGLFEEVSQQAFQDIRNTIELLSEEQVETAARSIARARFVLVCGLSSSAGTATGFHYRLARYGIPSCLAIDNHIQRHVAATLERRDVAVLFSFSGSTREIIATGRIAVASGAATIAITNHSESPLCEGSSITLNTGIESDPLDAEVASRVAVEFLVTLLFERVGELADNARGFLSKTFEATADRQL